MKIIVDNLNFGPYVMKTKCEQRIIDDLLDAGNKLNLRCILDGEYKIGNNWSQTH